MKKLFSVVSISFVFLLCILPVVNATPQTFTIPLHGSQKTTINLNEGDYVTLNVTVSEAEGTDDPFNGFNGIDFKVLEPDGKTLVDFNIENHNEIISRLSSFKAPATGTYQIKMDHYTNGFAWLFNNSSKIVTLDYTATSSESRSMGMIGVILVVVVMITTAAAAIGFAFLKRPRKTQQENQRESEIATIKYSSNVSWDDKKRGILLRCGNAWLTDSQFYFNREFWQVSDMTEASVDNDDSLVIRFTDGKTETFRLAPDSAAEESTEKLAALSEQTEKDAFNAYMSARTLKWAQTINTLIAKKTQSQTIVCEYCGAKNKPGEPKCFNCGALLK